MEWTHKIYYIFCFFVLVAPADHNSYSVFIQNITFILSFPQFHFFRAYLESGPPAAKTVVHGLMTALTYVIQSLVIVLYLLTAFGYFPRHAATFLQTYPHLFCVLTSLRPFFLLISLYLLYLAIFGLVKEIRMEVFLNLDHEATVRRLNIASGIIVPLIMLADLWRIGTTCNPKLAALFIKLRIGIPADFDKPTKR